MSNYDFFKNELLPMGWYVLVILFITIFIVTITISWVANILWPSLCYNTYNDSKFIHWLAPACKVKYNWEYISEELYIKAFESNLNVNIK